jgi:hypothetical protein
MKSLLVLAAVLLLSVEVSETGHPFELKGETPGTTTLKQFKTNHKHSKCSSETSHMTLCRVDDGVSFAGVTTEWYKRCSSMECSAQGIFADFVDGRMVSLTYGVFPNSSAQIIEVLKTKFGTPTETTKTETTSKTQSAT